MERLPEEEMQRTYGLLRQDELTRDPALYVYANDILVQNSTAPFSIWSVPNADIARILAGEIDYDAIPWEDNDEIQKGMLFGEQRAFVAEHYPGKNVLCEARNYERCLGEQCRLFRRPAKEAGGTHGICSEFKIAFQR